MGLARIGLAAYALAQDRVDYADHVHGLGRTSAGTTVRSVQVRDGLAYSVYQSTYMDMDLGIHDAGGPLDAPRLGLLDLPGAATGRMVLLR